jgi:methyltransferase (TIGR00027 family)
MKRKGRRQEDGRAQVVILGAGLDTRAIRKQAPNVVYFKIDDEDTLSFKKAKLAENRLTAHVSFISGNYVTGDFIQLLKSNDFDCSRPTHFIWEGNTMYLTAVSMRQVMADIAHHIPRFTLSFDYFKAAVINKATGDAATTLITERFAAMGTPWISGIIHRLADEAAMAIVDNVATAELHRAYWPDKTLDTAIFDYYFLCMQSPAPRLKVS